MTQCSVSEAEAKPVELSVRARGWVIANFFQGEPSWTFQTMILKIITIFRVPFIFLFAPVTILSLYYVKKIKDKAG